MSVTGRWLALALAALGCAEGDVVFADVDPLEQPFRDGGFTPIPPGTDGPVPKPPQTLDAEAPPASDADAPAPIPDAADPPPPPDMRQALPPGACRRHEDCAQGEICVADLCTTDPGAQRVGNGACTNPADEAELGRNVDLSELAGACALACIGQDPQEPCVVNCVQMNTGFSAACGACVGQLVACLGAACFIPCTFQDDVDCFDCRQSSCDPAFERCSGYRVPRGW